MKSKINISQILLHLTAAVLIIFAFYKGHQASNGINWVFDKDMVRNISMAQSMLDGYPLSDSIFHGESIWYNPFVPALTAAASKISSSTLIITNMKIGAYINLIVPIGFYLLLLTAFNARVALVSLTGMLFVFNNTIPTYMAGTYSAVTYALHFAPGFFFLSLLFYIKGRITGRPLWYILSGLMLGLACLAHTTAVLILATAYLIDTALLLIKKPVSEDRPAGEHRKKTVINLILIVFFSVIVASPLIYSILIKYRLKTLNSSPSRVIESILRADKLEQFIQLLTPHPIVLLFTVAGFLLMLFKLKEAAPRILIIIFSIVLVLIAYSFILQIIPATLALPTIVPGLHYIQYLGFLEAVAFGLGTCFILDFIFRAAEGKSSEKTNNQEKARTIRMYAKSIIIICLSAVLLFLYKPMYLDRWDFNKFRNTATKSNKDLLILNDWLVKNIEPQAVMFEDNGLPPGIMMAARKMIINPAGDAASNTFVDYMKRWRDRNMMMAALENKDYATLTQKFNEYKVKYVLENAGSSLKYWGSPAFLKKIYQHRQIAVHQVDYNLLKQAVAVQDNKKSGLKEPFYLLSDENLYESASVFNIEDYQFNYLENAVLQKAMRNWRWLRSGKQSISLSNLLKKMKCGSILVAKRKDIASMTFAGEIDSIDRNDLAICNFTSPKEFIKIGDIHPEKVIIFCSGGDIERELRIVGARVYLLNNFMNLSDKNYTTEEFIKESSLLVFNSQIYKKYLKAAKKEIESGKNDRKGLLISFLRQASQINY